MNPYEGLQNLVDQVPTILQPLIVALAGMIPYVEGEGSAALGVIAGVHPVIAGVAGAAGNILAVFVVVHFGDRIRSAVKERRARKVAGDRQAVPAGISVGTGPAGEPETGAQEKPGGARKSKGRGRLMRWVVRFGVPGASLIGPLALPTHLTAATLVAAGVRRNWVLLWQVIAIVLWTTAVTLVATGILTVLTG